MYTNTGKTMFGSSWWLTVLGAKLASVRLEAFLMNMWDELLFRPHNQVLQTPNSQSNISLYVLQPLYPKAMRVCFQVNHKIE